MQVKQPNQKTIVLGLDTDLYEWLESEKDRMFTEQRVRLPVTGVIRMLLERARQEAAPTTKKKKATP